MHSFNLFAKSILLISSYSYSNCGIVLVSSSKMIFRSIISNSMFGRVFVQFIVNRCDVGFGGILEIFRLVRQVYSVAWL